MKKGLLCLLPILILCAPLALGGCALFPSSLRGVERLALVQALGLDRAEDGLRLSLVTAADSSRGEGPVRMSGRGATIREAQEDAASRAAEERILCAHTAFVLLGEDSAREDVSAALRYVCRSREIRMDVPLLIVVTPYATTEEKQKRFNTAADIAAEYGVPFIDYNLLYEECGMDFTTDMADDGHLNAPGAAKFTSVFGAYLAEHYDIPDHRGDEAYTTWDLDAKYIYERLRKGQ